MTHADEAEWATEAIRGAQYLATTWKEPYAVVSINGKLAVTTLRSAEASREKVLEVCNP